MEVSFLIPYKPDNGQRDKIFKWVYKYYKTTYPNAELCIGTSNSKIFSKSEAVNNAASKATKDIFVILDADLIIMPATIQKSIRALNTHPWVIPYIYIYDIDKISTQKVLKSPPLDLPSQFHSKRRKKTSYGGVNIMYRDTFFKVNGFDERFVGWGGEDDAFMASLSAMVGIPIRFNEVIYHLWHPRANAINNPFYNQNVKLAQEYSKAIDDQTKMAQILKDKENFTKRNS